MRLLLIGPPGVGKGTQATMLKDRLGLVHLASGDIFRHELKNQTDLGMLAKSYMDKGELVPDEVTIDMMAKHLIQPEARESGFILDGFPRTEAQATALAILLDSLAMPLDKVVIMEVPDEVVVERLGGRLSCLNCGAVFHKTNNPPKSDTLCDRCGSELTVRDDDRPETVRERLRVYHAATAPVIEYFERHSSVLKVDAAQKSDDVLCSILDGLQA